MSTVTELLSESFVNSLITRINQGEEFIEGDDLGEGLSYVTEHLGNDNGDTLLNTVIVKGMRNGSDIYYGLTYSSVSPGSFSYQYSYGTVNAELISVDRVYPKARTVIDYVKIS